MCCEISQLKQSDICCNKSSCFQNIAIKKKKEYRTAKERFGFGTSLHLAHKITADMAKFIFVEQFILRYIGH